MKVFKQNALNCSQTMKVRNLFVRYLSETAGNVVLLLWRLENPLSFGNQCRACYLWLISHIYKEENPKSSACLYWQRNLINALSIKIWKSSVLASNKLLFSKINSVLITFAAFCTKASPPAQSDWCFFIYKSNKLHQNLQSDAFDLLNQLMCPRCLPNWCVGKFILFPSTLHGYHEGLVLWSNLLKRCLYSSFYDRTELPTPCLALLNI